MLSCSHVSVKMKIRQSFIFCWLDIFPGYSQVRTEFCQVTSWLLSNFVGLRQLGSDSVVQKSKNWFYVSGKIWAECSWAIFEFTSKFQALLMPCHSLCVFLYLSLSLSLACSTGLRRACSSLDPWQLNCSPGPQTMMSSHDCSGSLTSHGYVCVGRKNETCSGI